MTAFVMSSEVETSLTEVRDELVLTSPNCVWAPMTVVWLKII